MVHRTTSWLPSATWEPYYPAPQVSSATHNSELATKSFANANETIEMTIDGATQADLGTSSLTITTATNAQDSIAAIDEALGSISATRGNLSAVQNRFESSISNLGNISENLAASNSRIADADIAAEVSNSLKNRILAQAGVAVQAQANQSAGVTLGLLSR